MGIFSLGVLLEGTRPESALLEKAEEILRPERKIWKQADALDPVKLALDDSSRGAGLSKTETRLLHHYVS